MSRCSCRKNFRISPFDGVQWYALNHKFFVIDPGKMCSGGIWLPITFIAVININSCPRSAELTHPVGATTLLAFCTVVSLVSSVFQIRSGGIGPNRL